MPLRTERRIKTHTIYSTITNFNLIFFGELFYEIYHFSVKGNAFNIIIYLTFSINRSCTLGG